MTICQVKELLGWHIIRRSITVGGVQKSTLFHAINVELTEGRQTYGAMWIQGFPLPNEWEPTEIPVSENFWEEPVNRKTVVDDRVQKQFKLISKMAQENKLLAILGDRGYVENLALWNGARWSFFSKFDKDANLNAQIEREVVAVIEDQLKADELTQAQVAS